MYNIVLIENRKDRLLRLLGPELNDKLFNFQTVEIIDRDDFFSKDQWDNYFLRFDQGIFDNFIPYDILFIHKSMVSREGHKNLDQFCRKYGKSIIYFSGGLTGITVINDGYSCLSLDSSIFYSSRLIDFLETNHKIKPNILEVAYGQKWQLSNLLKLKNLLHQLKFSSELNIELEIEIEDLIPIIEETFHITFPEIYETEKIIEIPEILNNLIAQKMIEV
jgi:hypothetical protein